MSKNPQLGMVGKYLTDVEARRVERQMQSNWFNARNWDRMMRQRPGDEAASGRAEKRREGAVKAARQRSKK